MNKFKNFKKFLHILKISTGLIVVMVCLDLIIGKSVYHPLIYLYKILSWFGCQNSSNCQQIYAPTVKNKNAMVVTTQHLASDIGQQILLNGGNAVDAAVAIGYALAVTEPCCGNLGGGGFMLIHLAKGEDIFLDFREKAPLAATPKMYLDDQGSAIPRLSTSGYLAVGVPGTVKGLDYALSKYGTISAAQAIAPAIELAEQGFILKPGDIEMLKKAKKKFRQPNVTNIFQKNGKSNYRVGDRLRQANLAQSLKLIANQGIDAFYQGEIANKIVEASQKNGGILSFEDLANYKVRERTPIHCQYRGFEIISAPPPGGGTTLCQMLNILAGYDLNSLGFNSDERLHLMISAMFYAYRDRNTYLGDPDFVDIPDQRLLSSQYAAQIRQEILKQINFAPQKSKQPINSEGNNTTHYSVVDSNGNAVAVTYTINSNFGAGVIANDTGFLLNNEMNDFTIKPNVPNQFKLIQGQNNEIEPGKRPLSSMSPTIVLKNNKVFLVTGSPGGSTIPTTILQVIVNTIDYQLNPNQAVNICRFHYQGSPNLVITEPYCFDSNVFISLWEKGYQVFPFINWGAAESIFIDPQTNLLYGINDSRKSAGKAIGY